MRLRLALASLVVVALACARSDEGEATRLQSLQTATEELAAARTAFEQERAAMQEELAAVRKELAAANAKLAMVAAQHAKPVLPREPPRVPADLAPSMSVDPTLEPTLPDSLDSVVRCETEGRCMIDRTWFEGMIADPAALAKQARIVPSTRDGVVVGLKLYGIRRGSLPKALGIKNGDLLRSINGHAMGPAETTLDALAKVLRAKTFTLELERKGAPLTLTAELVDRLE